MTTDEGDGGAGGGIALIALSFIFPGLFVGAALFLGTGYLCSQASFGFEDSDPLRMKPGVSTLTGTLIILATVGLVAVISVLALC